MKRLILMTAIALATSTAFAADVQKKIELKDGTVVHVFKDGKMAMEDAKGRTVRMKAGQVMEGKDGSKYIMVGDEVMRLQSILAEQRGTGG